MSYPCRGWSWSKDITKSSALPFFHSRSGGREAIFFSLLYGIHKYKRCSASISNASADVAPAPPYGASISRNAGLDRLRKNVWNCHPERSEGAQYFFKTCRGPSLRSDDSHARFLPALRVSGASGSRDGVEEAERRRRAIWYLV
jgi:hypothetical protein